MPAPKPPDAPFKPNLYVVARFLDALSASPTTLTRGQLQAAAGVNYDIFRAYLAFFEQKGYARVREDGTVVPTESGRRVRAELRAWIARFLVGESTSSTVEAPERASRTRQPFEDG